MLDKCEWVRQHADHLRRTIILEPRGHADMCGAILTEAISPGSHAGIIFMNNDGYSIMSGHAIMAVTTIALERGLLMPGGDGRTVVYDTPAGTVRATATVGVAREHREGRGVRIETVSVMNVPAFVLHGGLAVKVGSRHLRADVAFGGVFYAIVDAEAVGLAIDARHVPELRRTALDIKRAIEAERGIAHPLDERLQGIYGTVFTGPAVDHRADLRNVTVFGHAQVERSPSGTATAAVMAVLDAMGLLGDDRPFVHESLIGTRMTGRIAGRTTVAEHDAVVTAIEGSAWITGEHVFVVDEADPLGRGFRL